MSRDLAVEVEQTESWTWDFLVMESFFGAKGLVRGLISG